MLKKLFEPLSVCVCVWWHGNIYLCMIMLHSWHPNGQKFYEEKSSHNHNSVDSMPDIQRLRKWRQIPMNNKVKCNHQINRINSALKARHHEHNLSVWHAHTFSAISAKMAINAHEPIDFSPFLAFHHFYNPFLNCVLLDAATFRQIASNDRHAYIFVVYSSCGLLII